MTPGLPLDLFAVGRGLAAASTLVLVGACLFITLLPRWRAVTDDEGSLAARSLVRAWRVAAGAAGLLLLAHAVRAHGQVRSFLEPTERFTWEAVRPILTQTTWGRGWLAQATTALLALVLARLAARRPAPGLALLCTAAFAVVGTAPLTGHAGEHPWGPAFGIGLHALHLLGGGVWLGTLTTIAVAGLRLLRSRPSPADHAALARLIAVFSPLALIGAAVAVSAGLTLAWAYVGDVGSLTGTDYGRTLMLKSGVLLLTMTLGAWNWRRATPRLGTAKGTTLLTRSVTLELLLGLLLIAATAVLVALPAPKI